MISTRRIVAAAALAAGIAGLAAPSANAGVLGAEQLNPIALLDSLATSEIPAEHKADIPRVSQQLASLNQANELNKLNELHQVTDLVAPVTGLLPAVG
ncbi:hypothetical protein C3489_13510 [Streptomyces sp. Ru71]|uniref:hypothetical protein n=1 Tax=Streptomyces sp. Ru71 TaxID=2080746 RepID=UPI000CDE2AE1|nr:hypothetical protein [Streptomyces sp. Ru71]POX54481.1 hypothetical protein C3489_13510 [Streptomyces sp. Ru71]